jgi:hypothetical protein
MLNSYGSFSLPPVNLLDPGGNGKVETSFEGAK